MAITRRGFGKALVGAGLLGAHRLKGDAVKTGPSVAEADIGGMAGPDAVAGPGGAANPGAVAGSGGCLESAALQAARSARLVSLVVRDRHDWGAAVSGEADVVFAGLREPLRFLLVGDSHLAYPDDLARQYAARMIPAFEPWPHFGTGKPLRQPEGLRLALAEAKKRKVDFVAVVGDLVSFPSNEGVAAALEELDSCGVPWFYTAGNHDWHYEGMKGDINEKRAHWIAKRMLPLYHGENPLFYAKKVKGVRCLFIDNSTYEILPEQLAFFREQVASGDPVALFMHIPVYMAGVPDDMAATCGRPDWKNAKAGLPVGRSAPTLAFREEMFAAPNVIGVFCGHIHCVFAGVERGTAQVATRLAASGASMTVTLSPPPDFGT